MILEVFISYAHQDQQFRNELDKHLSNLRRQGIISSWSDGDIAPGTEWQRQVINHLDTARIILLLISADFMASDFCYSIEMTRALERHRANEARVLPIILRPTDWKDAPFAALEVLPTGGKAATRWPTVDDAFENVVEGIRRAIQEMAEHNERAARTDRIGQRFGDYWLRRRLGGGSFGDVYLGEHVHTHSLAAVKVLHVRLTRSEELRAFINEVRTFRLQHPHIVRLLDVGIAPDETPFLVMQYAPSGTLRDRHPTGSRVSLSTVLTYVVPIASALQYAHDLHLVHRDIKPENMLLGTEGELWLSDFGIATVAHSTGSLTTEGMGGTLPYMAPEQILGRPRAQSDQYALAIVVYEWLSGTRPFWGTPIEIAMQHQMAPPPALRTWVPTVPVEVEQVVFTALSKDPKDRFGNMQAFATALEQAAQASLEQSIASQRSQETPSLIEPGGREVVVEAAEAAQQQASGSDLTGPQTTDAFPSPSTANSIPESISKPEALPVSELPGTTEDASSPPTAPDVPGIVSSAPPVVPSKPGILRSRKPLILGLILVTVLLLGIIGGVIAIHAATTINPAMATDAINSSIAQMNARNIAQLDPALVTANPDPYPPTNGKLTLYDPMHDNTNKGFGWQEDNDCRFTGTAYQVNLVCSAKNLELNNFAFEIAVDFTQASSYQGASVYFRNVDSPSTYYAFSIYNDGTYFFNAGATSLLGGRIDAISTSAIKSDAIHQGAQRNIMAIVAIGSTIDLYVNGVKINSFEDSSSNYGGLFLANADSPVNFSNAKLWTF